MRIARDRITSATSSAWATNASSKVVRPKGPLRVRIGLRGRDPAGEVGVQRAFDERHLLLEIFVVESLEHAQDQVEARFLEGTVRSPDLPGESRRHYSPSR